MPVAPIVQTTASPTVIGETPGMMQPTGNPTAQPSLAQMLSGQAPNGTETNEADGQAAEYRAQLDRLTEENQRVRGQLSQRDKLMNDMQANMGQLTATVNELRQNPTDNAQTQALLAVAQELRDSKQGPLLSEDEIGRLGTDNVGSIQKLIEAAIAPVLQTVQQNNVAIQSNTANQQESNVTQDDVYQAAMVNAARVALQSNPDFRSATQNPQWEAYRNRQSASLPNATNGQIIDYALNQTGDSETVLTHIGSFLGEQQAANPQVQQQPQQPQWPGQQPVQQQMPQLPGAPQANGNPQFFTPSGTGARVDNGMGMQQQPDVLDESYLERLKNGQIEGGATDFKNKLDEYLRQTGQSGMPTPS